MTRREKPDQPVDQLSRFAFRMIAVGAIIVGAAFLLDLYGYNPLKWLDQHLPR